uniref:Ig-like domain-containing protein n=1 Tax=Callorhinchus milii TaxID=7868 RepID=A0A4W3GBZ5_CALMI
AILFTVSGPALPVPAIAGSDVVLDCKCSTDLPLEGVEVRWFRTRFDSLVHLYSEGRDQTGEQEEAYKHRTELFKKEFIHGNVSLKLKDVWGSDNGTYRCFIDYAGWYEEAVMDQCTLQCVLDGVRLLCESSGWFPAPEVLWLDDQGNNLTTFSNWTVREDSKGLYSVKSQIEIIHSTNKIRCLIHNEENEQEGKLHISGQLLLSLSMNIYLHFLTDEFFPKVPVNLVVSSVLLGLVTVALSFVLPYNIKQHREIKGMY